MIGSTFEGVEENAHTRRYGNNLGHAFGWRTPLNMRLSFQTIQLVLLDCTLGRKIESNQVSEQFWGWGKW